ncbi:MAG: AAA family ATPase [Thermomicrobiales bacterium]|nr:AAA family ATPase [Thermomicrobiales bacterium]
MEIPAFVIMSGPPAAGKTTHARPLAAALGYPLFAMDPIKEGLADAIGREALAIADALSAASVHHLLAIANEVITSGGDVMVEGFFRSGDFDHLFAPLVQRSRAVLIHLWADDLLLKDRYEQRALAHQRHWIHGDEARIGTLQPKLPEDLRAPLDLGVPRIFVNTSAGFADVDMIRQAVMTALQQPQSGDSYIGDMS